MRRHETPFKNRKKAVQSCVEFFISSKVKLLPDLVRRWVDSTDGFDHLKDWRNPLTDEQKKRFYRSCKVLYQQLKEQIKDEINVEEPKSSDS